MWIWLHKLGSPKRFYQLSKRLSPWFGWLALLAFAYGTYRGLLASPADYQQGESVRIMYVHVPAAWMSMFVYMVMAICSAVYLIWKITLADIIAKCSAPIGASFAFLALATGSLWGKPMWGTYWIWDARLTSELILLFIYLGYMGLRSAIEDHRTAGRACGVLALVGVVNIPIIHYSVEWWNTLHQGASVTKMDAPSIDSQMLIPLLLMALAYKLFFAAMVLIRARTELLEREQRTNWVRDLLQQEVKPTLQ